MPVQTSWRMLISCSAEVPGSDGCLVPQPTVPQCSRPFTIQHDLPPKKCDEKISLRVTPSVCACLSANASSFLTLGPPVGLQTLLTAHSYASLLPNSVSTGMRKEPKVFLDYIFGAWRYQRKLVKVVFGRNLLDWFGGSEDLNEIGRKGKRAIEAVSVWDGRDGKFCLTSGTYAAACRPVVHVTRWSYRA